MKIIDNLLFEFCGENAYQFNSIENRGEEMIQTEEIEQLEELNDPDLASFDTQDEELN